MSTTRDPGARRRGAFFGRRKGHRLRPQQSGRFATLLPKLALDLTRPAPADLRTLFPGPVERVRLEIGFGSGEHFLREASVHADAGFIGCEAFLNGMASALAAIEKAGLRNVRLHHGDALELLHWLPAQSLACIDLLYPDPWPKRRHWKRRFVSDAVVEIFARVTAAGATVRFATDIASYAEWTLVRFLRSPHFEWAAECADDWRKPWPGYGGTRYEAKAIREGRTPCYLTFRRM